MQRMLALVAFVGILSLSRGEQCLRTDVNRCLEQLQNLTNNQDMVFVTSAEELDTLCRGLKQAMSCITTFTSRCLEPEGYEHYMKLTGGTRHLINQMCTPGSDVRKKYLQHADCFKTIADEYRSCSYKFMTDQQNLREQQGLDQFEQLKQTCCIYDHHMHCSKTLVLSQCGSEAADLVNDIITTGGGSLVQTHCADYTYDSEHCSAGTIVRTSLITMLIGLLLAIIMTIKSSK